MKVRMEVLLSWVSRRKGGRTSLPSHFCSRTPVTAVVDPGRTTSVGLGAFTASPGCAGKESALSLRKSFYTRRRAPMIFCLLKVPKNIGREKMIPKIIGNVFSFCLKIVSSPHESKDRGYTFMGWKFFRFLASWDSFLLLRWELTMSEDNGVGRSACKKAGGFRKIRCSICSFWLSFDFPQHFFVSFARSVYRPPTPFKAGFTFYRFERRNGLMLQPRNIRYL